MHVGYRWYDPATGRFLQRDPIGIRGGTNVYAYVNNAPTGLVDPDGQIVPIIVAIGIGIAIIDFWPDYANAPGPGDAIYSGSPGPGVPAIASLTAVELGGGAGIIRPLLSGCSDVFPGFVGPPAPPARGSP